MKASELIEEPQAFMDMMGIRMFLMFEEAKRVEALVSKWVW
jgi:hypothetical protein